MAKNTETKTEKFDITQNIQVQKNVYIAGDKVLAEVEKVLIKHPHWGWQSIDKEEHIIRVKDEKYLWDFYGLKAKGYEPEIDEIDEDDED